MRKQTFMRRLMNVTGDERGAALVETALITPMLLALMIGIVEVGRYADYSIKVTNAARAGVQYGSQNPVTAFDLTGMQSAALADAQSPAPSPSASPVPLAGLTATASMYCSFEDGTADPNCAAGTSSNHRIYYVTVVTTGSMKSLFNYQFPGLSASANAALNNFTPTTTAVMRVPGS